MAVGSQERLARRPAQAAGCFRRLVELRPQVVGAHSAVSVLLEASDWLGAEAAARDLLPRIRKPEGLRVSFASCAGPGPEASALRLPRSPRRPGDAWAFERVQKSLMDERG
jgi:hypothetical protein